MLATYRIRIKTLEQIHHLLEEIANFLLRGVFRVAVWVDGVDASAVLAPLVSPEGLVVTVDVDPVLLHVGQEIGATLFCQDVCDVGVGTAGVAARLVGAVTVVGPAIESISCSGWCFWKDHVVMKQLGVMGDTYHRPWMVHESVGPVDGSVSQN